MCRFFRVFKLILLLSLSLDQFIISGQSVQIDNTTNNYTNIIGMRPSNLPNYDLSGSIWKATRFNPIYSVYGIEEFTSPGSGISIDGIPFSALPFNYNSIDLLPLDILQINSVNIKKKPAIGVGFSSSSGNLNLKRKPLDKSLQIIFRGYLGSVTGDPLIHRYTRPNTKVVNRNKIPPSGVLSISNTVSSFAYRFTAGYFGYFATGAVNDNNLRNQSQYFYGKLNKQVLASAEFEYKINELRRIKLFSSFISFYGWEITPFITNYAHLESYIHTIRLTFENLVDGVYVTLLKDGSIGEINQINTLRPSKFYLSTYSLISRWNTTLGQRLTLGLSSNITFQSADNKSESLDHQDFFKENLTKWKFGVNASADYKVSESTSGYTNVRYDWHYSRKNTISGELGMLLSINNFTQMRIYTSSVVKFPNLSELYGNITSEAGLGFERESRFFQIRGNELLTFERGTQFGLSLNYFDEKSLEMSTDVFYKFINDPISQSIERAARLETIGTILRDATYSNKEDKELYGAYTSLSLSPFKFLELRAEYNYLQNSDILYSPKNKMRLTLSFTLVSGGVISVSWYYQGKTTWDEFKVEKESDYFRGEGVEAVIMEFNFFDLSFQQKLKEFYFINEIDFSVTVQNLFNREIKYLPIGNNIDRAVIFSITTRM